MHIRYWKFLFGIENLFAFDFGKYGYFSSMLKHSIIFKERLIRTNKFFNSKDEKFVKSK